MPRLSVPAFRVLLLVTLVIAHGLPAQTVDDDRAQAPGRITDYRGQRAVHLSAEMQALAGIELFVPEASEWRREVPVQGKVLDLQPLLQLRAGYNQIAAEHEAAQASLHSSDTGLQRLLKLHDEGAGVSSRQLQEARSQREADSARVRAAETGLRDVRDQTLQHWGNVLTGWALDPGSNALDPFVRADEVLLLVSFTQDQGLTGGAREILAGRSSDRLKASPATLISAAPYSFGAAGETYFFRAPAGEFRSGMRAHAWAPGTGTALAGVFVPDTAVVWFAGRPWLYLRHQGELFARYPITGQSVLGARWFVPERSLAGSEVVTSGGQMLLSEESRTAIPDEDNDP